MRVGERTLAGTVSQWGFSHSALLANEQRNKGNYYRQRLDGLTVLRSH
jgi:hypothetical protein